MPFTMGVVSHDLDSEGLAWDEYTKGLEASLTRSVT
jgi:hypothetical protein